MKKKSCETGVHQLTLFLFFSVKGISNLPFLIINMFISQFVFNDSSYHVSLHISLIDFFFLPALPLMAIYYNASSQMSFSVDIPGLMLYPDYWPCPTKCTGIIQ